METPGQAPYKDGVETADEIVSPTIAGDWGDDDPMAIDDLVTSYAEEPLAKDLPEDERKIPAKTIAPPTRLLARNYRIPRNSGVVQVLPADPKRKSVLVSFDLIAGFALVISDDPSALRGSASLAFRCGSDANPVTLGAHTGPLYVALFDTTAWTADITDGTNQYGFSVVGITE